MGATLVRPGRQARQGEGAVHRLGIGRVGISEEIESLVPGGSFGYRAVSRLPVKHYKGFVEFLDAPGGTRVEYTLDVEAAVPCPGR